MSRPTKHLLFAGTIGSGRTALAAAAAVALADRGRRVLLVGLGPGPGVASALDTHVGERSDAVCGVPMLSAMAVDVQAAADELRRPPVGYRRGVRRGRRINGRRISGVSLIEDQLFRTSMAAIASFEPFSRLLAGGDEWAAFQHIVFDDTPPAHVLRLLELRATWSGFGGAACLWADRELDQQRASSKAALDALRDPCATTTVLVARSDAGSLRRAAATSVALAACGLGRQALAINGIVPKPDSTDSIAAEYAAACAACRSQLPPPLAAVPRAEVALRATDVIGPTALRSLAVGVQEPLPAGQPATPSAPTLRAVVDRLAAHGRGLILVDGAKNSGKTAVAAAVAVGLAARGLTVSFHTTDPAAAAAIDLPDVSLVDAAATVRNFADHAVRAVAGSLDDAGRSLLQEDLRSPESEEAAFVAHFAKLLRDAAHRFVVFDMVPSGAALQLVISRKSYQQELARRVAPAAGSVLTRVDRLRDQGFTRVLLVTRPEPSAVADAKRRQAALRGACIEPFAWVVNGTFTAARPGNGLLAVRSAAEAASIARCLSGVVGDAALTPWVSQPIRRPDHLLETRPDGDATM